GGIVSAGAQEVFPLLAIQGDAPPREAPPVASTLERYAGTVEIHPETARKQPTAPGTAVALAGATVTGFTVIAPTFVGANQNYSYIRFPNGGSGMATFNVT